nr:MAG TPA: hypothetical protein [Bacteriophage sp.]
MLYNICAACLSGIVTFGCQLSGWQPLFNCFKYLI